MTAMAAARYYVHRTGLEPLPATSEKQARRLARAAAEDLVRDGLASVYLRSPEGSPDVKLATYVCRDGKVYVERPDSHARRAWR